MRYKDGEIIELGWDCGPDAYYIKGHIDPDTAKGTLAKFRGGHIADVSEPVHKYARWSCDGRVEYNHTLVEYIESGRGRFKITVLEVVPIRVFPSEQHVTRRENND